MKLIQTCLILLAGLAFFACSKPNPPEDPASASQAATSSCDCGASETGEPCACNKGEEAGPCECGQSGEHTHDDAAEGGEEAATEGGDEATTEEAPAEE